MAEELYHTGQPMRSGRYPYGSGEDPYQRITRGKGSLRAKKEKILQEIKKKTKLKEEKKVQKEIRKSTKEKKEAEAKRYESLEGLLDTASKDYTKRYSDDELNARINRLKLEKEYRNLVSELNPKVKSRGKMFLEEVGGDILKQTVKEVGKQALSYALGEGLNTLTGKNIYSHKGSQQQKKSGK